MSSSPESKVHLLSEITRLERRVAELERLLADAGVGNTSAGGTNSLTRTAPKHEIELEAVELKRKLDSALRASETRFRSVVENLSEGLMLFDERANLIYQNPASLRIHGFEPASDGRIPHEALAAIWVARDEAGREIGFEEWPVSRVFRGERFQNQVLRVVRPENGREFFGSYNGAPVYDADGRLVLGFITIRDITEQVRARDALQRSELRLSAYYHSEMLGALYWTVDGQITGANEKFLRMVGYTRDDLEQGRLRWNEITPKEYRAADARALEQLKRARVDTPYEKEFIRKDGTRVPVLVGAAMVDEQGHEGVAFVLDITERTRTERALQEREQELRRTIAVLNAINESTPALVAVKDRECRYVLANAAVLALIGRSEAEAYGRTDVDWFGPEVGGAIVSNDRRVMEQGITLTVEEPTPGGQIWLSTKTPWRDERGGIQGVIVVAHEITSRKQAEEMSAEARRLAEEANRQKDDFLAMLGHELRNPLAPIRTATALLRMIGPPDPALQRVRDVIDRQVTHMTRLLDDLLDVSRIARGKITLRQDRFDVTAAVHAAVEDHRPLFDSNGVELSFVAPAEELHGVGDSARVAQIVSNLVVNANKFTNRGGRVVVELATERDDTVAIRVSDTGIGMDDETRGIVFEPFSQADHSIARSSGGLGLGLALVKGLAELHGGRVSAHSGGVGQGSEFVVLLPILVRAAGAPVAEEPADSAPAQPRRILIVEDNHDAAEMLEALLTFGGHHVIVAHSGPAAIEAARAQRPDVVLCDIGLPGGMDGYAVARALREDPALTPALLVALTGYGQQEDRTRARTAGFDRHLTKPVDPQVLQQLLAG